MTIKRRKKKSPSLFYTSDPHLTDSRLWGTRWPQRRATWRRRPWRRQRANSASWDPPVWWRCRSGSGTSPACCHAARYSARSSPRSAASCAAPGLEERRGPRKASPTRERRSKSEEKQSLVTWMLHSGLIHTGSTVHTVHTFKTFGKTWQTRQKLALLFSIKRLFSCLKSEWSQRMWVTWRRVKTVEEEQRKVPGDKTTKGVWMDVLQLAGEYSCSWRNRRNENRQVGKIKHLQ